MGNYRSTTGESPPLTNREQRRRRRKWGLGLLLVLLAGGIAGSIVKVRSYVLASGYVTTRDYAEVRPGTVGTVATIFGSTGDVVAKGDLLVQLDASEEEAALQEARSRANQIKAEIARRQAFVEEEKRTLAEDIEIAKLRLRNASTKRQRAEELRDKGLVAGSSLEDLRLKEELARAELTSLLNRDKTIFHKELAVLRQQLAARLDAVSRAEARAKNKDVRAPIAGELLRYEFVIGELVRPASVLYEIFGGDDLVLKVSIPERHAARVAPGQEYEAKLAPYAGLDRIRFRGRIDHLRNVIQTEGESTYRIAYCSFDPGNRTVPPGTTAEAKIYYGKTRLWFFLLGIK